MNPFIKDLIQVISWVAAVAVGGITAWKGIREVRQSTKQRQAELRWRQASATREILAEIHRHERAAHAVMMLDWFESKHKYEIEEGKEVEISYAEVLAALARQPSECNDETDAFVRDCFDWFLYYMDRLEHYIRTGLITFEDVAPVFRTYAEKLAKNRSVYENFLRSHEYDLAMSFWKRYWESAPQAASMVP